MNIDILVLNYNGKELMEKFMPSVCAAAASSSHNCRVYIIDNLSRDDSLSFIESNYPGVHLIKAKENRVLFSYNDIISRLDSEIVILLNNDIKVEKDFVDYLAGHFADEKVFFVAPRILNFDGTYNGGRSHFEFRFGIIKSVVERVSDKTAGHTQLISCGAFRRRLFVELGGFDDLYWPGIWEDADICYSGLQKGYKGIYEPRSVIWHDESTTFNQVYGSRKKMILAHRNMFLFFWKNITDLNMIAWHLLMIIPVSVGSILKNNKEFVLGLLNALPRMGLAVSKRRGQKKYKDKDIISWKFP